MRICFICGSIEPGKDGVGDYTRRLAGELIRQGCQVAVMAINDRHIKMMVQEFQKNEQESISVLRLPANMSWNDRANTAKDFLEKFQADWLSLQYVPFSFNDKGVPLALCGFLSKIQKKGVKWHFMLHELWVGELKTEGFKLQVIRVFEQHILKKLILQLKPKLIHTSNELYQSFLLFRLNFDSKILPVFSNIFSLNEKKELNLNAIISPEIDIQNKRHDYFIVTNFGSYYYKWWNIEDAIYELENMAKLKGKKLLLVSLGKISVDEKKHWDHFAKKTRTLILGMQSEENITAWLRYYTDLGMITTPYLLLNKSGSFQALKACKVPVLALKKAWPYRVPITTDKSEADYFFLDKEHKIIKNEDKVTVDSSLIFVAQKLISSMSES